MMSESQPESGLVIGLSVLLVVLLMLLFYLYKRLNRDTDGQYTVQRLVFSPGGLRDRLAQGLQAVVSRVRDLRSRLQIPDEEEGRDEDNEDVKAEENIQGDGEKGHTRNDSDGEDEEEGNHENSSDDYSSIDLRERVNQKNEKEKDEEKEKSEDDDDKKSEEVKNEERVGLFVDLKSFSGSAIWSGEKDESNVTAL